MDYFIRQFQCLATQHLLAKNRHINQILLPQLQIIQSEKVVKKIFESIDVDDFVGETHEEKTRDMLYKISTEEFFNIFERKSMKRFSLTAGWFSYSRDGFKRLYP